MKDFKEFLLRGNLVTTAVAFVIGLAFASVITAFVTDLITPLIAAIGGNPDFSELHFTINNSVFFYGSFLNALLTFVVVAAVIFYLVVKPYNAFSERAAKDAPETEKECPHCLSAIPLAASVCSQCTRDVG
jgi:large conductance mechanosensitive channel